MQQSLHGRPNQTLPLPKSLVLVQRRVETLTRRAFVFALGRFLRAHLALRERFGVRVESQHEAENREEPEICEYA